jgi:HNH endonuclease
MSASGRRCAERNFLELHHIHPYALDGPATVENISLRCRRHNQYEAAVIFGPREPRNIGAAGPAQ